MQPLKSPKGLRLEWDAAVADGVSANLCERAGSASGFIDDSK